MGEFILNGRNYGGSIITPNPSDTPTDTLDSVKIGDTTYEIQGGGGGGSNLIIDAQKYSLEEQIIGIWTDGKPIYQKTWTGLNVTPSYNSWTNIIPNDANIETLVRWQALSNGDYKNIDGTGIEWQVLSDYIRAEYNQNANVRTIEILTLQYTKTTDTAGSGGFQAYGFSPIIYSDVEREVGVWRDNKPLYQRTFAATSPSVIDTSTSIITMPTGIENVVHLTGFINQVGAIAQENLNFYIWYRKEQNDIACRVTNQNWVNYPMYVTVWYTKTTDVAGSGEYNTLAIPNVHYSTDEQVIGTWIDGKTLYQKTLRLTSGIVTGSYQTIPLDSTYIVNDYKGFVRRTDKRVDNFNGFVQTTDALLLSARTNGMEYFISTRFTDIVELCITVQYTKTTD